MSDITDAVDAIQQYAERNRAIIVVADLLTKLGSIEQATQEATTRRDAAIARLNETTTALEEAHGKLGEIRADADRSLTAAQKQADDMVTEARAEAEAIVTAGRNDAADLRQVAERDAAIVRAGANDQLDSYNTRIGAAKRQLDDINAEVTEATARLDQTKASIATMRETAKQLLG